MIGKKGVKRKDDASNASNASNAYCNALRFDALQRGLQEFSEVFPQREMNPMNTMNTSRGRTFCSETSGDKIRSSPFQIFTKWANIMEHQ